MRTTSKTPGLRIVAGTAYRATETGIPATASAEPAFRHAEPPLTETAKNGRLREKRNQIWRKADAATRYWRVRMDFDHAVYMAQREEIPEAAYHPVVDHKDLQLVERYREALVKQLLTPAPDLRSVTWKQAALAQGQYRYVGVSDQRIERAIAEDLAFLAAHPMRQSNRKSAKPKDDGGAA